MRNVPVIITRHDKVCEFYEKGMRKRVIKIHRLGNHETVPYISPNDKQLSPSWKVLSKEETQNKTYRRIAFRRNER